MIKVSDINNKEEIMKCLLDNVPTVYWKDKDSGRYFGIENNPLETLDSDLSGKTIYEALGSEYEKEAQIIEKNDNAIMESGKSAIVEESFTTPNGTRTFLNHKTPIFNHANQVIGLVGYGIEVIKENSVS